MLLDPKAPGLRGHRALPHHGGENLAEIRFHDIELPRENMIIEGDGMKKLPTAFNTRRCMNPSVSLGRAEGAFEEAVKGERMATASLTVNFLRQVRVGAFIEVRCALRKEGRKAIFADASAHAGDRLVATAALIWMRVA